jgi:hypothetical protein
MLISKLWGGGTVAEGVGRHGIVAIMKLSLVHCRFLCSSEVRAERTKKKNLQRASHSGARHNIPVENIFSFSIDVDERYFQHFQHPC